MVQQNYIFSIIFLAGVMKFFGRNSMNINEENAKNNYLRGFEVQVSYILKRRQIAPKDFAEIYRALDDMAVVLRTLWPGAKLELMGSFVTGLCTVASDLDCAVKLTASQKTNESSLVEMAATALQQYSHLFSPIIIKSNAIVSIVRTVHVLTSRNFDVNFNFRGLSNALLTNYHLHLDERAFALAVILKYWLELQKVNGEALLATYITTQLAVFYLQQKNLLPTVAELQKNVQPDIRHHWNHAFANKDYRPNNDSHLFELLVGCFEYYANFAFDKYVISAFVGYPVERVKFANYESLPREFELYKFNVRKNLTHALNLSDDIIIQSPFTQNANVASKMYHEVAQKAIAAFKKANIIYQTNPNPDEYLISILRKL